MKPFVILIIYLTFFIFCLKSYSQEGSIQWMKLEDAIKASDKKPKKILIDVYTNWCGPCKMLNANTFSHPYIASYINKHFYPVKFNAESPDTIKIKNQTFTNPGYNPQAIGRNATHQFTYAIANVNGRIAYPTIVYMDSNAQIIQAIQGYMTPEQIEPILVYFAEDHYKTTPWEEFIKNFKSSIR